VDSADKLLVGFVDNLDGKSYTVKIGRDVVRDTLSEAQYFDAVLDQMLSAHPKNKLIDKRDVQFHGRSFHRLRFRMHTEKWGELCMHAYMHRTGTQSVAVQIAFPCDVGRINEDVLPPAISKLDINTRLFPEEDQN
jgi:hypothetical protein